MINLIPTSQKQDISYARHNSQLVKWLVVLGIVLTGILAVMLFGHIFIQQSIKNYTAQAESAKQQLQAQKLEDTQKRLEDISNNFKLANQVLGKEVIFSKLLQQIGAAVPSGVQLSGLQLDKLQGGLTITAQARDIQSASQLQLNLQDPKNNVFEKADIENISCAKKDSTSTAATPAATANPYPCVVQVRALFGKNNQYYFINNTQKDKQ